jgi:hypothetical protein
MTPRLDWLFATNKHSHNRPRSISSNDRSSRSATKTRRLFEIFNIVKRTLLPPLGALHHYYKQCSGGDELVRHDLVNWPLTPKASLPSRTNIQQADAVEPSLSDLWRLRWFQRKSDVDDSTLLYTTTIVYILRVSKKYPKLGAHQKRSSLRSGRSHTQRFVAMSMLG